MKIISRRMTLLTILIISGLVISGCSNKTPQAPTQQEVQQTLNPQEIRKTRVSQMSESQRKEAFNTAMSGIKNDVKTNSRYTKIKLDKPIDNRKWFKNNIYKLWSGEIDKDRFINEGTAKYPTKNYEFYFIATSVLSK
jgi:hypothetical protein